MESAGGELPFLMSIADNADGTLDGYVVNGDERAPFTSVSVIRDSLFLDFEHYDSSLRMAIAEKGERLHGVWVRRGTPVMNIAARKNEMERFPLPAEKADGRGADEDISGSWNVLFRDSRGTTPATGVFKVSGEKAYGTFLTATGDYRFLEGMYANGVLKLSCFDGSHAYLFTAKADAGGQLIGDYYSGTTYHATWTARRGEADLPDPYAVTKARDAGKTFEFAFPDLEGNMVSNSDERFGGKVLIVNVYGSWCPNCNDEAPFLAELYDRYRDRGLEIIGLANEFSDDFSKNVMMVKRFIRRHKVEWTQLVVGRADKEKTAQALRDLTGIAAYPTTIFVDRLGKIRKIHTGFAGPATGKYYEELRSEFIEIVESML